MISIFLFCFDAFFSSFDYISNILKCDLIRSLAKTTNETNFNQLKSLKKY